MPGPTYSETFQQSVDELTTDALQDKKRIYYRKRIKKTTKVKKKKPRNKYKPVV